MATPTLIQHLAGAIDIYPLNTMSLDLPNLVLSGNCLIMGVQFNSSGSITSISDNKSNTWVSGPTVTNATSSKTLAIYYVLNAIADTKNVVIHFSGFTSAAGFQQATISEFNNIALSSASDGSSGSATSKTSGSITTTVDGDLIYQYGAALSSSNGSGGAFNGTSITKGSGFTLLNADLQIGTVAQYQVQSSAGAINPAFTTSGSATWGSLAIAFKNASAGTAMPSGIRIVHLQHTLLAAHRLQGRDTPIVMQFPCTGNLLVGLFNGAGPVITGVTDGSSNTWSIPASCRTTGANGVVSAQIVYAANATTSTDLAGITVAVDDTGIGDNMMNLYDVTGATSSPFDVGTVNLGTQTSTGPLTSGTITPTTSNGLVCHVNSIFFHTENACTSPTGSFFDTFVNDHHDDEPGASGEDVSPLDMDNAYAHFYNPNTAALSFTFTNNIVSGGTPGVQQWGGASAAFKGAPVEIPLSQFNRFIIP